MQSSNSKQSLSNERASSFAPALISTSLGGAILGGSLANMTGALLGGAFGIVIAIYSEYRNSRISTQKNA